MDELALQVLIEAAVERGVKRAQRETRGLDPAMLNKRDAARYLGICLRTLEQLQSGRTIRPVRIGRKVLFPREQLDAYIRSLAD